WYFFCQAEDGIRDRNVTGVRTCALPIFLPVPVSPCTSPMHGMPGMGLVHGETGTGKTTALTWLRNRPHVNAVYVRALALWTPSDIGREACREAEYVCQSGEAGDSEESGD